MRTLLFLACLCVLSIGCARTGMPAIKTGSLPALTPVPTLVPSVPGAVEVGRATRVVQTTHAPTPTWTLVPTRRPTPSPIPSPTPSQIPSPTPDPRRPVVAFVSDWTGDDDVYLLDAGTGEVVNLTNAPGEDRDPVFAPGGRWLTFRSDAGGRWAFYRVDLATGERTTEFDDPLDGAHIGHLTWDGQGGRSYAYESYRDGNLNLYIRTPEGVRRALTRHPAGDFDPAWRPGASQVAFVSWREGQKDLYLVDADGSDLVRLTDDLVDEEGPAWDSDGQRLAFVRWQDHDADLYELEIASGAITRLTDDPYPDRSPTYAPDGRLFWVRYEPGQPFEVHDPYRPGRWRLWRREADGRQGPVSLPFAEMDAYMPAAGLALWPEGASLTVVTPTPTPSHTPDLLVKLDIQCASGRPYVRTDLVDAYQAWRAEVKAQSGYDFLGTISDMYRPLGYGGRDYGHLSWHRTGRAVDLVFEWRDPADGENRLLVVREDLGAHTYWRLYLRCREQDGTMGEPLTVAPWIFWFDLDVTEEPAAVAAGGKPGAVPPGYYVDVTRLAKRHGWRRIASYKEADFDWRTDSVGREFWHYQRTDGLTWWQAMNEIYPQEALVETYGWNVCVETLGMDAAWLPGKGIPTPVPGKASTDESAD